MSWIKTSQGGNCCKIQGKPNCCHHIMFCKYKMRFLFLTFIGYFNQLKNVLDVHFHSAHATKMQMKLFLFCAIEWSQNHQSEYCIRMIRDIKRHRQYSFLNCTYLFTSFIREAQVNYCGDYELLFDTKSKTPHNSSKVGIFWTAIQWWKEEREIPYVISS